jgi:hypothetical protein
MRKNRFFHFIVIGCLLAAFAAGNSIYAQSSEVILAPIHDSYAKGHSSGTGGPAGAEERMRVRFREAGEWRFDAYTKFDISSLEVGLVESAVVRLYTATTTGGLPIDLQMQHTAPSWDEATLVASNRPQWLNPLVITPYSGTAGWYQWDVTSLLKTLLESDASEISLVITPRGSGGDQDVYFHSKENPQTQYHPQLVITLTEVNVELVATSIMVDGVSLEGFDSNLLTYNFILPAATIAVPAITAVANDETATVTVTPAAALTGTEMERTTTVTLTRGDVVVVYAITFELEVEVDELLATSIMVDGVSLEGFDSNLLTYNFILPAATIAVPAITAVANHQTATVTVTPAASLTGTELERTTTVILTRGDEVIVYTILFELEEAETIVLAAANISVGGKTIDGFDGDQFIYTIIVSVATPGVPAVTAIATDPMATVIISPAISLTGTQEQRTTTVTILRDDETVVYSIVFETAIIPLVLTSSHDTYTPGHTSNASGPFGAEKTLRNRFRAAGEWRFDIYLKFDIAKIEIENLDRAVIRLYTDIATAGLPIELRMNETGTQWSETDLVAANRPQWLEVVSTANYTGQAGWYEWDVSNILNQLLANGKDEVSVVITPQGGGGQEDVYFISKENDRVEFHPQLVIEFSEAQEPLPLVADNISIDGVTLTGFTADQFTYSVILPASTLDIPVVTASSANEGLSVVQAVSLTGSEEERTALIILTRDDEVVTYTVTFELEDTTYMVILNGEEFSYTLQNRVLSFNNSGIYTHYHLFTISGSRVAGGAVLKGDNTISIPSHTPGIYLIVLSGSARKTIKLPVH